MQAILHSDAHNMRKHVAYAHNHCMLVTAQAPARHINTNDIASSERIGSEWHAFLLANKRAMMP